MAKLTKSQQKIYDYLLSRRNEGIPPTVREIRDATGFKSTSTIHAHLNTLEKLGLISKRAGLTRAIMLSNGETTASGMAVPLIPEVTGDENTEFVVVDSNIKHGRELSALRVTDDSMINAGILNGDTVVFAKQAFAENGDIIVVRIDDVALVRRFYREDGYFRLEPENPNIDTVITEYVRVIGKVITLVRNYE